VLDNNGRMRHIVATGSRAAAIDMCGNTDTGVPRVVLEADYDHDTGIANLEIYPLPDVNSDFSDGEYRIVIPYHAYIPVPGSDSGTNWFTVNAEQYLINEATGYGFGSLEDEMREDRWLAKAEAERMRVIQADKYRMLSTMDTLVPHKGANEAYLRSL
jgi:hypothetical protein